MEKMLKSFDPVAFVFPAIVANDYGEIPAQPTAISGVCKFGFQMVRVARRLVRVDQ